MGSFLHKFLHTGPTHFGPQNFEAPLKIIGKKFSTSAEDSS